MRGIYTAILAISGLLALGCAKRNVVEVPPRVDLHEFKTIGIIQFESSTKGSLAQCATQRFVEALQESQPGVRVLELGPISGVEGPDKNGRVDFRAAKKIGDKYHVNALIIGELVVKDVRPHVDVRQTLTTMRVSADVDAILIARMFETEQGATTWTRSSSASRTVAQVGLAGQSVRFDAQNPENAYGELVNALVYDITYDFRPSYVRD